MKRPSFDRNGADPAGRNRAWPESLGLAFRLVSDLGPEGQVGRLYSVWDDLWRLERRATFLVDNHGVIRYVSVGSLARDGRGVLEAVAKLQRAQP